MKRIWKQQRDWKQGRSFTGTLKSRWNIIVLYYQKRSKLIFNALFIFMTFLWASIISKVFHFHFLSWRCFLLKNFINLKYDITSYKSFSYYDQCDIYMNKLIEIASNKNPTPDIFSLLFICSPNDVCDLLNFSFLVIIVVCVS